jgi:Fe-S-cluster containining protein
VSDPRRVHFGCSRCGACCNSTPQLSLPELFRHEATFIGCLGVRRIADPSRGKSADEAGHLRTFLSHHAQPAASGAAGDHVLITAQAYNDPLSERCSALAEDKLCRLQHEGKPLACRSVPLEATLPDALQLSVLLERARDARFMGADCIQPHTGLEPAVTGGMRSASRAPGHLPVLVDGARVVDPEARQALELRRAALRLDRSHWGDRVFQMLRRDLFDHPERVLRLPEDGYLCLSLAPALSVISSFSNALTRRVVEYLNAQIELIALTVGAPVKEPTQAQRELAAMLRTCVSLRAKLQAAPPLPRSEPQASEVEAWLANPGLEASHG